MLTLNISDLIIQGVAFLMALTFHECAHAWAAKKLGDPTAEAEGRLTLNPIPHIDPVGTVILPLLAIITHAPFFIGWAKPVPINARNFRNPRRGLVWSAAAGPGMNLALAILSVLVLKLFLFLGLYTQAIGTLFVSIMFLNVGLAVFNMLPIPPLDGGTVLTGLLPRKQAYVFSSLEPYGFFIILGLSYFGILRFVLYYPTTAILRFLDSLI